MSLLELKKGSPAQWQLSGELTYASLSEDYKKLQAQRPGQGAWHLNCQGIKRIDSAGIAYLLDCVRYSQQQKLCLRINRLPELARNLMQAQGVAELINPYLEQT